MKINFLGDSITHGYAIKQQDIWTSIIQAERNEDVIINKGINGDTTAGMLSRFQVDVVADKPDIVHIMGGANDIICCATADQIKGNFNSLSRQAKSRGIKTIIGIQPLPIVEEVIPIWKEFSDFNRVFEEMKNLNKWLHKYCAVDTNVLLIDYAKELEEKYNRNLNDLYIDGLHLNEKGNKILAEIFLENFSKFKL